MWHLTAWSFFFLCGFTGLKLEDWYEQHLYDVGQSFVPNVHGRTCCETIAYFLCAVHVFLPGTNRTGRHLQGDAGDRRRHCEFDIWASLDYSCHLRIPHLFCYWTVSFSRSEVLWHCGVSCDRVVLWQYDVSNDRDRSEVLWHCCVSGDR